jgi:hypothetical protein
MHPSLNNPFPKEHAIKEADKLKSMVHRIKTLRLFCQGEESLSFATGDIDRSASCTFAKDYFKEAESLLAKAEQKLREAASALHLP